MERHNSFSTIELPPGFRFHPTDEELVTRYLSPKVLDSSFSSTAIGEVDLNKVEPWDLPWKAKMGEKEWYFFFLRDRKYPTGSRANRATDTGYWKATGKDKEIFRAKILVGMKKTLVFYRGRAPRGERTNWVMHEYRLHGKNSFHALGKTDKSEWVICRVFKKSSGGKKVHISGLHRDEDRRLDLPSLMDMSFDENRTTTKDEGSHVTCYSNPPQDSLNNSFDEYISFANKKLPNSEYSFFSSHLPSCTDILNFSVMPDQTNASFIKQNAKTEFSEDMFKPYYHELGFKSYDEDQVFPTDDCLWNY